MITYNFYKADRVKQNGKAKLYLRVTINRKHKFYNLLDIDAKLWNKSKGRIKPVDEESAKINIFLNNKAKEVDQILLSVLSRSLDHTFENFEKLYFKQSDDILIFFQSVIDTMHEPEYSHGTVRLYMNCLDKLKTFTKDKPISIQDIDYTFIADFDKFLTKMNLVKNTRASQLKKLNKVLNDARKKGLIQLNPFVNFQIKQEKTHRVFLVGEELKKLKKIYDADTLSDNLQSTLHAFLFSCYTGLRHSDVVRITYGDINDNVIDLTLKKRTSNGDKRLIVPLSKKAAELIDLGSDHDCLIFPNLITSTKCAVHLKAIAGVCGIKKNVTFHAARHTFATISLGLGIDLKKVSELLGHDSIKTTEIYAHLVEEHLIEAVDKWDNF